MKRLPFLPSALLALFAATACPAIASAQTPAGPSAITVLTAPSNAVDSLALVGDRAAARIVLDTQDSPVVSLAANLFADDVARVTGRRPTVTNDPSGSPQLLIVGTLDKSQIIQKLIASGKLKGLDTLKGKWETTLTQVVSQPFPGVDRALVIVGSDRRGAAYGLMQLSQKIGVSPWYWWADVPPAHHDTLALRLAAPTTDASAVKYRGIFINDEDWGLFPWASKTFDPQLANIGPKTYDKVFELLLRLRLNYIWPAMHACSAEFASNPENYKLADKYGIVAGSSHCEPMLCNNVHWDEREKGRWNYSLNRDTIHTYWQNNVQARSAEEAVWTLGIRGIHDQGMQMPPNDLPGKINLMGEVFRDQRQLLDQNVTKQWGSVAQCFVPYKEVLPIYDAGLKVPDDVTLVWVDDNFGYIRRLSSPAERTRSGGAGVYWHLSYYGGPHSYTWINTTAPALMWEELHKAWDNDARNLWVINVGDIKPMELGIDYFSRLAWNPQGYSLPNQPAFLRDFAAENFAPDLAQPIADMMMTYYRLGTVRKPELMERQWALALSDERAQQLANDFQQLLASEQKIAAAVPAAARDAYTELVGFPIHVLADTGLIFMADRAIQKRQDVAANQEKINALRTALDTQVANYNHNLAGGKWNLMMPGIETASNLTAWNSQVRWPWGERNPPANPDRIGQTPMPERTWRNASAADRRTAAGQARWTTLDGLGTSGTAVALLPAGLDSSWKQDDSRAPTLEYDFTSNAGDANAWIDFLPAFRLYPGMKLRVTVSVDNAPSAVIEVPGSSGDENENGAIRSRAVQDNYVRAAVPLPGLTAGKHTFKIRALDPGAVLDRISLP
jgi:hypothetical protein